MAPESKDVPASGRPGGDEANRILETYARRESAAAALAALWKGRSDTIAQRRMGVFLAIVAVLVWYAMAPGARTALGAITLLLLMAFVVLVVRHARTRRLERWHRELAQVAREAQDRRLRRWDALERPTPASPTDHPYADDLDVFGHASLHVLLSTTCTRPGEELLQDWLLGPAAPDMIGQRQEAVRELTPAIEFRDELEAAGRIAGPVEPEQLRLLLEWAESPAWLLPKTRMRWLAVAVPVSLAATIVLHVFDVVPYLWSIPIMVALEVMRRFTERIREDFARASRGESGLRLYHTLMERVAEERFQAPLLKELRDGLTPGGEAAAEALARLFRYVEMSDLRHNPQVHFPVNMASLWDIHLLVRMERWKEEYGSSLRGWMTSLGRVDALSALAGLAHAHPHWAFPEVQEKGTPRLVAEGLAHPLLRPGLAVHNDVELGPPGSMLLVTGSNMSGKSTFLRAIGTNVVLAGAGGPVCAEAMTLPVVDLRTGMRIREGLEEGISYFLAELKRLKSVCEAASDASDVPVLYLLDEILQGTNTAERQIAARRILRHLLDQRAIGAVTTHDLTLADAVDLEERAVMVHFRESLEELEGEEPIAFDYRLREGMATSTNALKLMEIMGLSGAEEPGDD